MKKYKSDSQTSKHVYYPVNLYCIITFLVSLSIVSLFLFIEGRSHLAIEKERALYIAKNYATTLSAAINNASSMLYMMEALIIQGNGHVEAFDHVSSDIIKNYPFTRNIALAPDGILRFIYPRENEDLALGHNLLKSPNRKREAFLAQKTKQLTISGPFPLIQGGLGVVARLPVFWGPKRSSFWGMVCLTINFPMLIEQTELPHLEKLGYAYTLWRYHTEKDEKQILSRSFLKSQATALEYSIQLPNALWTLDIRPVNGWISTDWILLRCIMGLFICLLLTFLTGTICGLLNKKQLLESISRTDALTQRPNRLGFSEYSAEALLHARLHKRVLAICFIDMNGFKRINDTFGHRSGDALLSNFSLRLTPFLRKRDFLARIGGDEFVLLLEGDSKKDIINRMDLLLDYLQEPVLIGKERHQLSLSIGISLYPENGSSMEILLRQADDAMYHAKSLHSPYCFFTQDMATEDKE